VSALKKSSLSTIHTRITNAITVLAKAGTATSSKRNKAFLHYHPVSVTLQVQKSLVSALNKAFLSTIDIRTTNGITVLAQAGTAVSNT